MEKQIKELISTFFQKLDIEIETIEIVQQKENIFLIKIKTPES
jgi:ribosome maturation factor RimP